MQIDAARHRSRTPSLFGGTVPGSNERRPGACPPFYCSSGFYLSLSLSFFFSSPSCAVLMFMRRINAYLFYDPRGRTPFPFDAMGCGRHTRGRYIWAQIEPV